MANTYAFSIFGALLLAVTLAPVLCSFFFHNKTEEKETFVDRVMKWRYLRALDQVLRFPRADAGGHGRPARLHDRRWSRASAASSCPSSRRETSGSGRSCPGRSRGRRPPGWRLGIREVIAIGARGPRRDVAGRTPRRRHRRHQLLQPRIQRAAPADGGMARAPATIWLPDQLLLEGPGPAGPSITREEIQDELMEQFRGLPGAEFQLLATHPRQHR